MTVTATPSLPKTDVPITAEKRRNPARFAILFGLLVLLLLVIAPLLGVAINAFKSTFKAK